MGPDCRQLSLNVGPVPAENALTGAWCGWSALRFLKQGGLRPGRPHHLGAPMLAQEEDNQPYGSGGMPLLLAADLQDDLMVASNDLERLQRLLDDASEALMGHFTEATGHIQTGEVDAARRTIAGAITALQFQDMACQLITHTSRRLRNCADRLARDTMGDDEDGEAVVEETLLRPNPVTQDEMDAGSIELF
jgi:ribosomal protein L29